MNLADKVIELRKEMIEKDIPKEKRTLILTTFIDSYEEHKSQFGSYAHLREQEYTDKMQSRYLWMKERAYKVGLGQGDNN